MSMRVRRSTSHEGGGSKISHKEYLDDTKIFVASGNAAVFSCECTLKISKNVLL